MWGQVSLPGNLIGKNYYLYTLKSLLFLAPFLTEQKAQILYQDKKSK